MMTMLWMMTEPELIQVNRQVIARGRKATRGEYQQGTAATPSTHL